MSVSCSFTVPRASFQPAYLKLWESGELSRRVELGLEKLADCALCPRNCHVNRLEDETKVCKTGRYAVVSSHFVHFGEERCLRVRVVREQFSSARAICDAFSAKTTRSAGWVRAVPPSHINSLPRCSIYKTRVATTSIS